MAQIHALKVATNHATLDHLDRRNRHGFVEHVARIGTETAGRVTAHVVLMQGVRHPAEDTTLPKHRTRDLNVGLVTGTNPGIVGQEHVAGTDTDLVAEILQGPLDGQIHGAGEILDVRAEEHELAILGQDHGIEIVSHAGERRARHFLDGYAVLVIDVPQRVAQDLEGDRVQTRRGLAVQGQCRMQAQFRPGNIGIDDAIPARRGLCTVHDVGATSRKSSSMMMLP